MKTWDLIGMGIRMSGFFLKTSSLGNNLCLFFVLFCDFFQAFCLDFPFHILDGFSLYLVDLVAKRCPGKIEEVG